MPLLKKTPATTQGPAADILQPQRRPHGYGHESDLLKEELTKEREVILEELAMIMDQLHQRFWRCSTKSVGQTVHWVDAHHPRHSSA